jgi:hypothetical protein
VTFHIKRGGYRASRAVADGRIDSWFEEDAQIYDHPKNPYTRIDILPSSRKIKVKIADVTVAETSNPLFLFETGLRTRYYLPKTSVRSSFASFKFSDKTDIEIGEMGISDPKQNNHQMSLQRIGTVLQRDD